LLRPTFLNPHSLIRWTILNDRFWLKATNFEETLQIFGEASGVRLRCGGPHPSPSGETSPAGHQELPGDHAGTAGQGAQAVLDRDGSCVFSVFWERFLFGSW
jgi:hypothetical protein